MLIRSAAAHPVLSSEITPEGIAVNRRAFIAAALALSGGGLVGMAPPADASPASEPVTPFKNASTYNNFYEFGFGKDDPAQYAGALKTDPWTIVIDGLVKTPVTIDLAAFLKPAVMEERTYRHRCVEGWSMVIPWNGFPLAAALARAEPLGSAKYVAFQTLVRPSEMPGQNPRSPTLPYPYVEGLRLDEAMHPLTILATGMYGAALPNQNGAPIRLVVPWKYGFKGIKSIVRITLVEKEPPTTWSAQNASEYGFYSNVNPAVDHPRWTQASERRIGEGGLFAKRRPTLPFNGYADEVASFYDGMDLKKFF